MKNRALFFMKITPENPRTETLLYVEDNQTVRIFTASCLRDIIDEKKLAIQILTAENAEAALKIIKEKRGEIVAVLTDCEMDGDAQAGIGLVRKLIAENFTGKIAMLTGSAKQAIKELEASGIEIPVFDKSVGFEELEKILESLDIITTPSAAPQAPVASPAAVGNP